MRLPQAKRAIGALYLLFGISVISWVPRMPEIKAQLSLGAGAFGFLLSLGTAGSLIGTLVMGHVISRVGSRPVLTAAMLVQLVVMVGLTHVTSPAIFAPGFILFVACGATTALALNSQGTHVKDLIGEEILGRMHGLWSVGALLSGIVSSAIADHITLAWHIAALNLGLAPMIWYFSRSSLTPREERAQIEHEELPNFSAVFRPSRLTVILALGMTSGALIEYASGDWAAIYAREEIGASLSRSGLAFTSMMIGLTAGRFIIDRLTTRYGSALVVRGSGALIFIGVMILGPGATAMVSRSSVLALALTYVGFAIAGLGSSGMVPIFITAAARSAQVARSVVLAQVAVLQSIFIWVHKAVISTIAENFSISTGLIWPAMMALVALALANLTQEQRSQQPAPAR